MSNSPSASCHTPSVPFHQCKLQFVGPRRRIGALIALIWLLRLTSGRPQLKTRASTFRDTGSLLGMRWAHATFWPGTSMEFPRPVFRAWVMMVAYWLLRADVEVH